MKFFPLFILLVLIFLELRVFKKWQKEIFLKFFELPKTVAMLLFVLLGVVVFSQERERYLMIFVLMVVVPLFLLRRDKYLLNVDPDGKDTSDLALITDGIGIIVQWLFTVIVATMVFRSLAEFFYFDPSEFGEIIVSASVSSIVILILVAKAARKFSDQGFKHNVALIKHGKSAIRIYVFPFIIGLSFAVISAVLIVTREVQPETPLSEIMGSATSPTLILIFIFLALGVAPFVEEVTFRGYYYHIVNKIKGKWVALFSVALSFAALHVGQYWGDWAAIVMVGILGFVLTYLRVSTGSTVASVVMHYTYNIGVTIIPLVLIITSNPAYFQYQIYYELYDTPKKEQLLMESIAKQPDLADAYNDLAWLYAQEEIKLEKAIELVNKALIQDPENTAYLDTKAVVLEKLNRIDEAQEIRKKIQDLAD